MSCTSLLKISSPLPLLWLLTGKDHFSLTP
jgi:hypothetical protein